MKGKCVVYSSIDEILSKSDFDHKNKREIMTNMCSGGLKEFSGWISRYVYSEIEWRVLISNMTS